eukprot:1184266-Prorocentrum_minimum.AAC.3
MSGSPARGCLAPTSASPTDRDVIKAVRRCVPASYLRATRISDISDRDSTTSWLSRRRWGLWSLRVGHGGGAAAATVAGTVPDPRRAGGAGGLQGVYRAVERVGRTKVGEPWSSHGPRSKCSGRSGGERSLSASRDALAHTSETTSPSSALDTAPIAQGNSQASSLTSLSCDIPVMDDPRELPWAIGAASKALEGDVVSDVRASVSREALDAVQW